MTLALPLVAGMVVCVIVRHLARLFRGTKVSYYSQPTPGWWPYWDWGWAAAKRLEATAGAFVCCLALLVVAKSFLGTWRVWHFVQLSAYGLMAVTAVLCASIVLFARPRWLIPVASRDEHGALHAVRNRRRSRPR